MNFFSSKTRPSYSRSQSVLNCRRKASTRITLLKCKSQNHYLKLIATINFVYVYLEFTTSLAIFAFICDAKEEENDLFR
jgi:hypothetical protein